MRVLSGMRPTGSLHLGHLKVLETWLELQVNNDCLWLVADLHALTTDWPNTQAIRALSDEMVGDWLAAGIDPKNSIMFRQSDVPEHSELFLLLAMITPLGWLERNPTYKEAKEEIGEERVGTLGFLSYPVLQSADILIYKAEAVPVGKDQIPHLEIARDIAGRFNYLFGDFFPIPEPILAKTPKILGLDGRKMSKSYENAVVLTEDIKSTMERIRRGMTDTARKYKTDPGEPERCPIFTIHKAFTPEEEREHIERMCRTAGFGCLDCKEFLLKNLVPILEDFQGKRRKVENDFIEDVLREGSKRAREIASETIECVKRVMKLLPP